MQREAAVPVREAAHAIEQPESVRLPDPRFSIDGVAPVGRAQEL
jgi:hypothetical protein